MPEEILFENERRQTRAEVAGYLRSVADRLDGGGPITFTTGGEPVSVNPPAEPTFEVKVERETAQGAESGELSIELELEWNEDAESDGGNLSIE